MNHSYCFIVNCASNSKRAEKNFNRRIERIRENFKFCKIIYIYPHQSIIETAREAAKKFSHVIACGGDGTANRVANGLSGTSAIMGVLPFGSGNDFSGSIGMTNDLEQDLQILLGNNIKNVDLLQMTDGVVINTFGLGVNGLTNFYAANSSIKNGSFKYFWSGLKALLHAVPFPVQLNLDDTEINTTSWMIVVANGTTEGGKYKVSPNSVNTDGKVEVVIVKPVSRLRLIIEFIKLSFGLSLDKKLVEVISVKDKIVIDSGTVVKAHFDGEQAEDKQQHEFILKQGMLRLVTAS